MRVLLAGLRGAGKTTVGEILARELELPFYDSDRELEQAFGEAPSRTIQLSGWDEFRRRERAVVQRLARVPCGVLALGGGAPVDPENQHALSGWEVFLLDASDEELALRTRGDSRNERPPLTGLDPLAEIAQLRKERWPCYLALRGQLAWTAGKQPAEVAAEICRRIAGGKRSS